MNDNRRKEIIAEQQKSIDRLLDKLSEKDRECAGLRKCITLMGILILILICIIGLSVGKGQTVKKFRVERVKVSDQKCKDATGGIEIKDRRIYINVPGYYRWHGYVKEFEHNGRTYYDVQSSTVTGFFIVSNDMATLTVYSKRSGYYLSRYYFKKQ